MHLFVVTFFPQGHKGVTLERACITLYDESSEQRSSVLQKRRGLFLSDTTSSHRTAAGREISPLPSSPTRAQCSSMRASLRMTSQANNAPACVCRNATAYFHRTPASSHRTAAGREIYPPPSLSSSPFLRQCNQHQQDESGRFWRQ